MQKEKKVAQMSRRLVPRLEKQMKATVFTSENSKKNRCMETALSSSQMVASTLEGSRMVCSMGRVC